MKRIALFLAVVLSCPLFAQTGWISGTVTDESGMPLIGAAVIANGEMSTGVVTDLDGKFKIACKDGENTLYVSIMGYADKTISAISGQNVNIVMAEDSYVLEGVVFTGYGAIAKKDMTGAVGVVSAKELNDMPVTSVNDVLQGKVAGLTVTSTSGAPGSGSVARIRGIGSITGSTTPLYVVDGLPQDGIDYLNPNDIESIAVHKDASVAAIYGSKGSNGIIVITTKSGSKDSKISISYDGYAAVQNPWKRPYMLNAEKYIKYKNLAADNAGQDRIPAFSTDENIEAVLKFVEKNTGSRNGTDWWNEIINKNAFMQNHNVSINGGNKTFSILSSLAFATHDGIVKGSNYQRLSWRNNFKAELHERVSLTANVSIIDEKRHLIDENNPATGTIFSAMGADPITPVFRNNLVEVPALLSQIFDGYEPDNLYSQYSGILFSNKRNPVAQIHRMRQSVYEYLYVKASADLEIRFLDVLKFNSRFSMDLSRSTVDGFQPKYSLNPNDKADNNKVVADNSRSQYYLWEQLLSYDQSVGKFKWGALIGTSAEVTNVSSVNASIEGLPSNDKNMAVLNSGTENAIVTGYPHSNAMVSVFGRANFDYDSKYLIAANLRYDGSSKFAKGYKWGLFPSVSAAWRFSAENFLKPAENWLSDGKLRVSYGHIGNQNISGGAYMSTYQSTIYDRYNFGNPSSAVIGAGITTVGNPVLMWETSRQFDVGLDLSLFNSCLDVTADYFIKDIAHMLMEEPQPATLGFPAYPYANVGSMRNEGWEFGLTFRKTVGRELFLTASGNISTYKNVVTSIGNGDAIYGEAYNKNTVTKTEVGKPVGYFYGYVTNGIFQNAEQVEGSAQRETAVPGDIRFKDLDRNDILNDKDRTFIGSPWPDFVYGLSLGASWKGFDLNMFFQGSQGNDVMNMTLMDFESGTGYMNARADLLERAWNGEGSTDRFHQISEIQGDNLLVSDYFLEDGSYLRLKNIQLGYDFAKNVLKGKVFSQLRLYVSAQNLFTLTKYSGLDPEIGSSNATLNGIDCGFYPQSRVWTVGLNLKF